MENEVKKSNKGLYAIITILCIAVLGLGGFIVYDKFIKEDKKEETSEKENPSIKNNNEETEKEITDTTVINDISTKVSVLLSNATVSDTDAVIKIEGHLNVEPKDIDSIKSVITQNYTIKQGESTKPTLDDIKNKGQDIYNKLKENMPNYSSVEDMFNEYINNSHTELVKVEDFDNTYYDLFGSKPTKHDDIKSCPWSYYDENGKVYLAIYNCGDTGNHDAYVYREKYTQKGDYAYAYIYVGSIAGGKTYSGEFTTDEAEKLLNGETISRKVVANDENIEVAFKNSTNEFEGYKLIFKKNANGNYSYNSYEAIK